ncbi:CaiB/BaiF CoA transferase family protein [Ornithinicoccus halotolerans]|uniref:CaiB/BaiF CoA transferase family protein n=1 Tax=Ornithinicoccus halotolerans TaxID=1748220 RepID=UPI0012949EDE|nr:CaiB/BaiF CoA-transferase family protein [Ornithinicoccus halotolerans]
MPPRTAEAGVRGRPLAGVVVLALEQAVAGPFATRQLADLGARVIKIERPGTGDFARGYDETVQGMSSAFFWANRSKESIALDLKHPDAPAVLERLVSRADVLVQNLAPGAAERLGLDSDRLRADHPRLVVCNISGYGQDGPYRDRKAYDLLVQGEAGIISLTGTPQEPAKVGTSIADIAGGMYAYSGVLAALLERERTGEGTVLDVSLFDSLVEWMSYPLYYTEYGGTAPARMGTSHPTIAPYGAFRTKDGHEVLLAVQSEREWRRFCGVVLGDEGPAEDPRFCTMSARVANRPELQRLVGDRLAALTVEEAVALLDRAEIASAHVTEVTDLADHPQLRARGRWRDVDSPVGQVPALVPPVVPRGADPRMDPVPELGAHTDSVLRWLGYTVEDTQRMRQQGLSA